MLHLHEMKTQNSKFKGLHVQYIPSTLSLAAVGLLVASVIATGHVPGFFNKPQAQSSAASELALIATPNPVQVCSGVVGATTLRWTADTGDYRVHANSETGPVIASPTTSGSLTVTDAQNNTTYYLRKATITTTYEWTYNKVTRKWERMPVQSTTWSTIGQTTIAFTTEGCETPRPVVPQAPISGTFVYPQVLSTTDLQKLFAELKVFGIDTVIISQTKQRRTPDCTNNEFVWGEGLPGKLDTIFSLAEANNVKVYVGLISAWCPQPNTNAIVTAYKATVQDLLTKYSSRAVFAGWYIPDEPSLASWVDPTVWHPYWAALAASIREYSNKPIIVSPILGGAESRTPAQIASRAVAFKQATGIDIQAWQDSEQTWALNLNWQKRGTPALAEYFNALGTALGKNGFWADIEVGNCCDGWAEGQGGAYYPASLSRVRKQIESSSAAGKIVSWIHQVQMSSLSGLSKWVVAPGSERLGAAYRAWYGMGGQLAYLTPARYTWTTQPAAAYPDSGRELTDGISGDPKRFDDSTWVGITGNAVAEFSFDAAKKVDWVGVHVLHAGSAGIKFPTRMRVACKVSGNYEEVGAWNLPITQRDSEYVLSNTSPLNAACKDLRLTLDNAGGWIFLSEVEIVGKN